MPRPSPGTARRASLAPDDGPSRDHHRNPSNRGRLGRCGGGSAPAIVKPRGDGAPIPGSDPKRSSMAETVVRCQMPECQAGVEYKIAAPWSYGRFAELKTYGFSCAAHPGAVLDYARRRPKPISVDPGEA